MRMTKKIEAIQSWDRPTREKTLAELIGILAKPLCQTSVKCSARACQVAESGSQFKLLGEQEIRMILNLM